MFFDVKFELRMKARMVVGGNMNWARDVNAYCGVVKIDTVRTYLFIGKLNDLDVTVTDVEKAYLHGFTKENI